MKTARGYFLALAAVTVVGLTIGALVYGEPYLMWRYPLSFIGYVKTYPGGQANDLARMFFSGTLIIDGAILLALARYWQRQRAPLSVVVTAMSALGLIMAAFSPDDVAHARHVFSTAIAVGGLWLLATMTIRRRWLNLLVQIPLIAYAIIYCWFDYSWYPAVWQKIALICLLVGLLADSTTASPENAI